MLPPPPEVPPARLFRLMLRRPRPWLAIDLSIAGIRRGVSCVALTTRDWAEVWDAHEDQPEEAREHWRQIEVVARSLHLEGKPLGMGAPELADSLHDYELTRAVQALSPALATVSPQRGTYDPEAWMRALRTGAREIRNERRAFALAMSFDPGWSHNVPRPDRFFGVGPDDLTEGQWIAFFAARKAFDL